MGYNKHTNMYEGYIYLITNKVNNKKYVGQTKKTIANRWNHHKVNAKSENPKQVISKAIKKYGCENFSIVELCKVERYSSKDLKEKLNDLEIELISYYDSLITRNGYNVEKGGSYNKSHTKEVDVYNIYGEYLGHYCSITDAAEKYDVSIGAVSLICRGLQENYNNKLVFRYKDEPFDLYPIVNDKYKYGIYQFTKDGDIIGYYNYMEEAYKATGISIHSEYVGNPNILQGGYWWSFDGNFLYHGSSKKQKIDIYNKDTLLFISTCDSMTEASKITSVPVTNINKVCNGLRRSAQGFIFRYHGDLLEKYSYTDNRTFNRKLVNQYSKDGKFIATFSSVTEATLYFTSSMNASIRNCCMRKNNYNTAYGYKWYYADDIEQPDKTKIIN